MRGRVGVVSCCCIAPRGWYAAVLRSARAATEPDEPTAPLDITPLSDVTLVLLVLFILVLPPLTREVPIDLPRLLPDARLPPVPHRLVLARAGGVTLDGAPLTDAALAAKLAPIVADRQATLTLRTDPETRYERFDQVLAVVKRAGVTRLGFERPQQNWSKTD